MNHEPKSSRSGPTTRGLSRDEEARLARAWREDNDLDSRNRLVTAYVGFAHATARSIAKGRGNLEDLRQEAALGLLDAADRFDPDLGWRFSTYSSWWIRARVNNLIIAENTLVSVPTGLFKKLYFSLNRTIRAIEVEMRRNGVAMSGTAIREEASRRLNIPLADIDAILPLVAGQDKSLDEPVKNTDGDEGRTFVDILVSPEISAEERLLAKTAGGQISAAVLDSLSTLSPRDRSIVEARWLGNGQKATLEELAKKHGVSREAIRQIEIRSFQKMARHIARGDDAHKALPLSGAKIAAAKSRSKLHDIRRS